MATDASLGRLELLLGNDAVERLKNSTVFLCGVGGVGSWCAEALARSGVGHLILMDDDTVKLSNMNRQLCALHSTIGKQKVSVLAERLRDIAPDAEIVALCEHLTPESAAPFLESRAFSCVIDAIDERPAKLALIAECVRRGIPVISSMGAGNKRNPALVQTGDISESRGCRLARIVRKSLRKLGIERGVRVVFSPEEPAEDAAMGVAEDEGARRPVGTLCPVTAVFGLLCASEAMGKILEN